MHFEALKRIVKRMCRSLSHDLTSLCLHDRRWQPVGASSPLAPATSVAAHGSSKSATQNEMDLASKFVLVYRFIGNSASIYGWSRQGQAASQHHIVVLTR